VDLLCQKDQSRAIGASVLMGQEQVFIAQMSL
jgi:hypothetical protein